MYPAWSLLLPLIALLMLVPQIVGVKHQDFRTCSQTAFCQLYRCKRPASSASTLVRDGEGTMGVEKETSDRLPNDASEGAAGPAETVWSLRSGRLVDGSRRYEAMLQDSLSHVDYVMSWTATDAGWTSLNITDAPGGAGPRRYVWAWPLSPGVVLELARSPSGDYDEIRWQAGMGARFYYQPFRIEGLRQGQRLFQFNGDQRLRMGTEGAAGAGVGAGPALAFDVDWLEADQVYGIPEHATRLALPSTLNASAYLSDPYRLYNLDVFDYELHSTMALYGSIPFMMGHSTDRKVGSLGLLWSNPTEMWIDVQHESVSEDDKKASGQGHQGDGREVMRVFWSFFNLCIDACALS